MISLVSLHLLAGRQHIACIVGVLTLTGLHHLAFFLVARYQLVFYMFDAMSQTNSSPCGYHGCAVWDLELGLGAVMHAHGFGMASRLSLCLLATFDPLEDSAWYSAAKPIGRKALLGPA